MVLVRPYTAPAIKWRFDGDAACRFHMLRSAAAHAPPPRAAPTDGGRPGLKPAPTKHILPSLPTLHGSARFAIVIPFLRWRRLCTVQSSPAVHLATAPTLIAWADHPQGSFLWRLSAVPHPRRPLWSKDSGTVSPARGVTRRAETAPGIKPADGSAVAAPVLVREGGAAAPTRSTGEPGTIGPARSMLLKFCGTPAVRLGR